MNDSDSRPESTAGGSLAEAAYAEFLLLCEESGAAGESAPDFEEFCRARPHLANDLRRIQAGWERAAGLLEAEDLEAEDAEAGGRAPFGPEDRYELLGEVGRGGMGLVFRVRDKELRRTLAMKALLPDLLGDRRATSRFLAEAQVTGQLEHPGIVPIHDVGVDRLGRDFYTMPLVRGRDGGRIFELARTGRDGWTTMRALGVLLRVCEAVAAAHARGVVHRDLKPSNVMVGSYEEVYVLDWGLARLVGSADGPASAEADGSREEDVPVTSTRRDELGGSPDSSLGTQLGQVVGTPSYMSPEQGRGEEVDARTDVYSVGAMLYLLLRGYAPYVLPGEPSDGATVLARLHAGPPEPLRSVAPGVAPELAAICERAMARDRGDRYADMRALTDDLRAFLEVRVVRAYRTGAVAELRSWVRRNRRFASTILALVLALAGGLAAALVLKARSDDNARLAALNFESARDAVDRMLTRVGHEELADVPRAQPVRRALLEDAIELYDGLIERRPGDDQLVRDLARAQFFRAMTVDLLGDTEGADAILTESLARTPAARPDGSRGWPWAATIADQRIMRADLRRNRGRVDEARADLEAALEELDRVSPDDPALDPGGLMSLRARIRGSLGALHLETKSDSPAVSSDEASEHLQFAIRSLDELRSRADPSEDVALRRHLAVHLERYGGLLTRLKRNDEAAEIARRVVELREESLAETSDVRDATNRLIIALSNLAVPLAEQGDPEAGEIFERILAPAATLVQEYPNVPAYRRNLALHRMNLATWQMSNDGAEAALGGFWTALRELEGVVQAMGDDRTTQALYFGAHDALVGLLSSRGDHRALAELVSDLEERGWQEPFSWGRLAAQGLASCADAARREEGLAGPLHRAYGERATEILRAALETGEITADLLEAEWLEPLRGHASFARLRADRP